MDSVSPWVEALVRWTHVLAGMIWLGAVYLSPQLARAGAAQGRAGPVTMPGAPPWVRWCAVYGWTSGLLLLAFIYYLADHLVRREVRLVTKYGLTVDFTLATDEPVVSQAVGVTISVAAIVLSALAYEAVLKVLGKHERAAAVVAFALFASCLFLLSLVFTERAVFIHAGVLLGTVATINLTRHGGPRREGLARANGVAPAAEALRAIRARHNACVAPPLTFAMISNHYPTLYDRAHGWVIMALLVPVGWVMARLFTGEPMSPGAVEP